jgi:hypothetical protein
MTEPGADERDELSAEVRAALTPDRIRAATRARLMARAATDSGARSVDPQANRQAQRPLTAPPIGGSLAPGLTVSRGRRVPTSVFGAVTLALAASLLFVVKLSNDAANDRAAFVAADQANSHRIDSLSTLVAARDQLVSSLTGAQVRVVGLSAGETKSPRALMFWDKSTDRWTFIAHNLAQLRAGRTYQLWLVTAGAKISAGTFSVTASGDAFVQATYVLERSALKAVAVTDEPAGGMPQPTGAPVVVGTAGTQ